MEPAARQITTRRNLTVIDRKRGRGENLFVREKGKALPSGAIQSGGDAQTLLPVRKKEGEKGRKKKKADSHWPGKGERQNIDLTIGKKKGGGRTPVRLLISKGKRGRRIESPRRRPGDTCEITSLPKKKEKPPPPGGGLSDSVVDRSSGKGKGKDSVFSFKKNGV